MNCLIIKKGLAIKKFFIIFMFFVVVYANNCNKRLFSLHIVEPINLKFLLIDLVNECQLNIILKDKKAKEIIHQDIEFINVENVSLKKFLDVLFTQADLFYELKGNNLIISYYKTQTFELNFIPNSISGTTGISNNIDKNVNTLTTKYNFNFWDNLKNSIIQLLKNSDEVYKNPIIDKNSGLITVTGTKNQIEEIKRYIDNLNNSLHKEVLIDVKIYTVELSKSHQTGIKWSELSFSLPNKQKEIKPIRDYTLDEYFGGSYSIFSGTTFNISGFLNFLAQNGNVNSISNPKIVTLNNQKAIISVGDTIYYKYKSSVTNQDDNPNTQYTIESKFVGVLLDITPQISNNGEIVLSINPKISTFKDPNQLLNSRDMPPDTKDNTLMSVVRLKDNDTLVLGGLITNDKSLIVNGVPILKEIPLIKYLFSSKEEITSKKELVFVITPRIIDLNKKRTLKDYGFKKLPTLEDLNVK